MIVHSNSDSVGKLKTVLVGNVSTKTLLQESKEWNVPFKQLKEECEEDRAYFVKVLKQLGIDVVEMPFIDETTLSYEGLASVRNNVLVLDNEIVETISYLYNNKKYFKPLQDIFKENKVNSLHFDEESDINHSLKCKDESFFNNYPITKDIEKNMNLLFFKSFSVILSESIATKKVNTKAKIHCHTGMLAKALPAPPPLTRSIISKINPPKIIGMLNKKLYSAALPSSLPASMSDEIVLPDLEMPGRTANP